jgi:peptide/nickel transport system permease protein
MGWIVRRILISIVLIWAIASVIFLAIRFVPGDPVEMLLSAGGSSPDPSIVAELREHLGLNKPIHEQYLDNMKGFLTGDLGRSLHGNYPVLDEILNRLPRTLELVFTATLISMLLGLPLGALAAIRYGRGLDRVTSSLSAVSLAFPIFVTGTLLVYLFGRRLQWVPVGIYQSFSDRPFQHLLILLMPAVTIAVGFWAVIFRTTRNSVLDVVLRDYVRTARAKGASKVRVMIHHIVRNALLPVVTVIALHLGSLLGGTVLVEYVFNWPGLSGLLVESVYSRDYPVIVGVIIVISTLFVALNAAVDVVYGLLDPRAR